MPKLVMETRSIKVLVVDDSAIVRKVLTDSIASQNDLEVVGTAPDPYIARDKILALKPDVLTLDIEMPRMDGLTFLKKVMQYHPMPVIIVSSLGQTSCQIALDALRMGAVEVLAKPGGPYSVGELRMELATKIRAAAAARIARTKGAATSPGMAVASSAVYDPATVIAIGSSTGGTEALKELLMRLPANSPGILITQHIPPVFSRAFANRMNDICPMEVKEAEDGDALVPGRALIAPGNFHMLLRKSADGYRVQIKNGPQVCYQRPSVDVMFSSVAEVAGARAIGVILTGMGADGAQGMLRMKHAGARNIAQDEASCVVYGMPREAARVGAADRIVPLLDIPAAIFSEIQTACR
ncbi:MAG TPA: chemotaxis response regulator protein-glutamate methylesterase [Bryobacteraceae bacterium]|jgi:two-component system chemotaxis response regulator CheB|nr:chemotaxis response regulator protein-glutamate methylesterase [Bryobacteraceae bacterium]